MDILNTDFGRAADDYARYRARFPRAAMDWLEKKGIGFPGQALVDLGTGTGDLARRMAEAGCAATGVDHSEGMLAVGRRLIADEGLSVRLVQAEAEHTGLPDQCADAVVAGQCWHWFRQPDAGMELRRLLRPGGRAAVMHFDWLPEEGNVVAATEALILGYNPEWHLGGGDGRYPSWAEDLRAVGMVDIEVWEKDLMVPYSHEDWRGRIRASAGVGGSLIAEGVEKFDAALAKLLRGGFPNEPLKVPHRIFGVVATAPGADPGL